MEQFKHLLGRYNDTSVREGDDNIIFDVIRIDGPNAYTRQGTVLKVSDLGSRYEKLEPRWMGPDLTSEVLNSMPSDLRVQAEKHKAQIQAQVSQEASEKILKQDGLQLPRPTIKEEEKEETIQLDWMQNAPKPTSELEKMIVSSMKLGSKHSEESSIAVNITLHFPFDIEKIVAGASMMTGSSDIEILEAIFKYCPIKTEDVKKSLIEELMKPAE